MSTLSLAMCQLTALLAVFLTTLMTVCQAQSHFYTVSRGSGTRGRVGSEGGMMDTLQRGHEGVMMQIENLNKAIKEDELKLNNVFYKLGRHDTDIQSTTAVQISLRDNSRKLEAKLNKQSYNVDFLRRHVSELKRSVTTSANTVASVATLKATVAELQQSLAQTLYRTQLLENKTSTMKQGMQSPNIHYSPGLQDNNIYYASKTPKTTYYYLNPDSVSSVCPESNGWSSVPEGGCWWLSDDRLSFVRALAACTKMGGVLAQPPPQKAKWPASLTASLRENISTRYWTSATDAFSPGEWVFLFSGDTIRPHHWANNTFTQAGSLNQDCAAVTAEGLVTAPCAMRYRYACEKV